MTYNDTLTPKTVANDSCPDSVGMGGVSFLKQKKEIEWH